MIKPIDSGRFVDLKLIGRQSYNVAVMKKGTGNIIITRIKQMVKNRERARMDRRETFAEKLRRDRKDAMVK